MSSFDDLMNEALDAGVQEEWVDRVKAATAASPLRKERDTAVAERDAAKAEVDRYRGIVVKATFEKAGIKANPELLSLPDDLDLTDHAKVNEWGVANGLAEALPPPAANVTPEEEAAQAALAAASNGAAVTSTPGTITPDEAAGWPIDRQMLFRRTHPEHWEALKRGETVTGIAA